MSFLPALEQHLQEQQLDFGIDLAPSLLRVGRRDGVHAALPLTCRAHAKMVGGWVGAGGGGG